MKFQNFDNQKFASFEKVLNTYYYISFLNHIHLTSVVHVLKLRFLFLNYGRKKRVSDMCPRSVSVRHVSNTDMSPFSKCPCFLGH